MSTSSPSLRRLPLPSEFARDVWLRRPLLLAHGPVDTRADALEFPAIQTLLCRMPRHEVVYRDASGGPAARMHLLPQPDWAAQPLADRLAGETTSLMLTDVHRYDARYGELLDIVLESVAHSLDVPRRALVNASASFFLSSPHAVSSYHTDREHNFLFQIQGTKVLHVFPRRDSLLHELAVAFLRPRKGIHDQYQSGFEADAQEFELTPWQALYIPRQWPHWVQNGAEVSASLSLNFFSRQSLALERVYKANDRLRRLLLAPLAALRRPSRGGS